MSEPSRRILLFLTCMLASAPVSLFCQETVALGHYVGTVKTAWSDNGRDMTLLEDFSYIDPNGLEWKAPAGTVTDGATIPREVWGSVGGPFEGLYRKAAVIHDAACEKKDRSWESVHEMFYQAMRTAGVDKVTADIMYLAVWEFGPKWDLVKVVKGVPKSSTDEALRTIQHSLHSTSSRARIESRSPSSTNSNDQDITVRFTPPPNTYSLEDFEAGKAMIEREEALRPGSVTLEQIRNFRAPR